ncbi:hypothetical protein ACGK9R_01945 [Halomonas sp. HNIBRBA4712]|uniref:hypothetical protein n=1 Tax=Halomonas sp. HNIBRBA4712 TaxID=3373087 RepID=UPI003746AE14
MSNSFSQNYAEIYSSNKNGLIDLTEKCNHPIAFKYGEVFSAALINALPSTGRILPGWTLNQDAPFYQAVVQGISESDNKKSLDRIINSLSLFYSEFQPQNSLDWFGLNLQNPNLMNTPPWGSVLPWRARSSKSYQTAITKAILKENIRDGFSEGIERGWPMCGPVTSEKQTLEAIRLQRLILSIREKGYIRSDDTDGDIKATALIDKDEKNWVWIVTSGYHRACVLAALEYLVIPIRINNVVHINHVDFWPHVQDGLYTPYEATDIFYTIFNGKERN